MSAKCHAARNEPETRITLHCCYRTHVRANAWARHPLEILAVARAQGTCSFIYLVNSNECLPVPQQTLHSDNCVLLTQPYSALDTHTHTHNVAGHWCIGNGKHSYRLKPAVKWAQRDDLVFITIQQVNITEEKVDLTPGKLSFTCKAGPEKKEYSVDIDFHADIVVS